MTGDELTKHLAETVRAIDKMDADQREMLARLKMIRIAVRAIQDRVPAPKAPKGKKKTFYREVDGYSVIQFGSQNPVDISSLHAARDYAEANPGSILEIVVRKKIKES